MDVDNPDASSVASFETRSLDSCKWAFEVSDDENDEDKNAPLVSTLDPDQAFPAHDALQADLLDNR